MPRTLIPPCLLILVLLVGCERRPEAAPPLGKAAEISKRSDIQGKPLVGKTFQADYAEAWCNRTPADWARLRAQQAVTMPDPSKGSETEAEAKSPEAAKAASRIAAEASAVASTAGRVQRQGSVLTVSGARFADDTTEGANAVAYSYAGRLRTAPFDVVYGVHWEWRTWSLVDAHGAKGVLSGPPVASPNGRAFAATGDDVEGESFNGVQIAEYSGDRFTSVDLEAQAACDPRWIDDDTLEIKLLPNLQPFALQPDRAKPSDWKTARVVRDGKGWKLIAPAA